MVTQLGRSVRLDLKFKLGSEAVGKDLEGPLLLLLVVTEVGEDSPV